MIHLHNHPHVSGFQEVFDDAGALLGFLEKGGNGQFMFRPSKQNMFLTQAQLKALAETIEDKNR